MNNEIEHALKRFENTIIFHPSYRHAHSQIQKAIENSATLGRPRSALLCGPSGTGKSTLCHYFKHHLSNEAISIESDGGYIQIPVFYCEVPADATVKGLISNMLRALTGETSHGTREKLTYQLTTCLKTCGVKVIFLDEIQRLCISEISLKVKVDSLAWIVSLLNSTGIPIILSGTEECHDIRETNKAFANRYPYFAELEDFSHDNGQNNEYFNTLLQLDKKLREIFTLPDGVYIHEPSIAAPLFVASGGNLGGIRLIINDALRICLYRKSANGLLHADFADACDSVGLPRRLHPENPFNMTHSQVLKIISDHESNNHA